MQYGALVFSGGGINGVAHVGCLAGLGDLVAGVKTVVGTSAGALVAAVFCLGLDMRDDVFRTLYAMDRRRLGSVSSFETMATSFGADDGRGLETLIRTFVPPALTFADLLRDRGKTLLVTATCLTDGEGVVFGPETHADMSVALAVRMSCSIPLVFAAVRHTDSKVYVDGSILDNFPIEIALRRTKERVLGISVSRFHEKHANVAIETFSDFARTLMGTIVAAAQTRASKRVSTIDIRSQVPIPTLFDVTDTQIAYLYNLGYVKGKEFRRKVA